MQVSNTLFRGQFAGSMLAIMLLMTVMMGLNAGITADSEAEIRSEFEEARDIDYEEQKEYDDPAVPNEYEQRLNEFENAIPSPTPESFDRAVQERVQSFVKAMTVQMLTLAEGIAIFAYNNQAIVGHPAVVMLTESAVFLAILGMLGWNLYRGYRGVYG